MKFRFRNLSQIGAILVPAAFICGLFDNEILKPFSSFKPIWLAIGFFILTQLATLGCLIGACYICLAAIVGFCLNFIAWVLLVAHFVLESKKQ